MQRENVGSGELAASVRRLYDEINWDYAVLERLNREDLSATLIPFNLGKVVLEGDAAHNLPLEAGDVVTVFSKSDVRAPAQDLKDWTQSFYQFGLGAAALKVIGD